jgi:hypothetical protein
MIFSLKPLSKYSFRFRLRCSTDRIDAPIEHPIQATSLGLKLHETKPKSLIIYPTFTLLHVITV